MEPSEINFRATAKVLRLIAMLKQLSLEDLDAVVDDTAPEGARPNFIVHRVTKVTRQFHRNVSLALIEKTTISYEKCAHCDKPAVFIVEEKAICENCQP